MTEQQQAYLIDYLIAQSTALICVCNEHANILKVNEIFAENAHQSHTELVGKSIKTAFLQENQKLNDLLYNAITNLDKEEAFITNIRAQDGHLTSVSWHICKFENLYLIKGIISKSYADKSFLDPEKRIRTIFDSISDCVFILDKSLNITFQNSAADKKFTHPKFKASTNVFFGSFPEETNKKFVDHFNIALSTHSHLKFVEFSSILNCWFTIDVLPYEDELNVLVTDISDRIIDHKINEIELKTFELSITKERPIEAILSFLLSSFEELYPHLSGSILKIQNQKLWHVASPKLPLDFSSAINGLAFDGKMGSCGTAAHLKKNVITFDIATDEKWEAYHHLITPYGYKSCWSFPILSNKSMEVMATFALYTTENLIPTESELKSIARICNIVKILFEDLKQDDAILLMNNRYEMVTMATNDAIYDWDLKTNNVYWSENLYNIFGFTPQEAHGTKNWWIKHIHRADRAETIKLLKCCLREKRSGWVAEYRLECKNGKFKHVYNRGYIIYDNQNLPISIIGAVQDITALKEREIEITNQNNKLKEIAQVSSHDLRRPVTSILGLISLFNRHNIADEHNIVVVDYLQKATQELDDVIHSIVAKTLEADDEIYNKPYKFNSTVFPGLRKDQ